MANYYLQPKRGQVDATTLKPNPLSDKPQTQFIQVEHGRDEYAGKRLHRYTIPYEFTFADIPACTSALGVGNGAGSRISLGVIPANARILNVDAEIVTAFVSTGTRQEIDGVYLNSDAVLADADITAAAGWYHAPNFTLAAVASGVSADAVTYVFPKEYAVNVTPIVYFTGNNGDVYSAGKMRVYVEVLSYFE